MEQMILQDICKVYDCPHTTAKDEGIGIPLVRTPNIGKGRLLLTNAHRVNSDIYQERTRRAIPEEDDIIIAREAPVGNAAIIQMGQKVCLGQRVVLLKPIRDRVDPNYLVYYLLSDEIQHRLRIHANGAVVAHLNMADIRNLPVSLPSLSEQKKIGRVLKIIDDKIELNRRINDNLEQQAQAMFKSWFVENASYSGVSISEYFLPNRGKNLLVSDAKGGKTPVVAGGLTPSAFHNVANTKAPVITISASGANAGFVNLWGIPVWAADSSYIDSTIVSNIYFWYNLLKYNQKNIYESQTGSAQPHIYPKHIGNLLIPDLDMRKVECYESIVTSMYLQINEIQQETKLLTDLRDTLLPKLMSGELKINDLNC